MPDTALVNYGPEPFSVELREIPEPQRARLQIEFGDVTLPGLPHSTESHQGSWKIIIWKQYTGRHPDLQ